MNLSILVGSCDKYSFLWDKFINRYVEYWNLKLDLPKYIQTETVDVDTNLFETIKCGDVSYTECIKHSLNQISTDYVLWLQDDYFFVRRLDPELIRNAYKLISENDNVIRVGINEDSKYYTSKLIEDNLYLMDKSSEYTISMQSSIWDRKKLLDFIENSPKETPWEFEINGTQRLNKLNYDVYYYKLDTPWYVEAMRKGEKMDIYYE